MIDEPGKDTRDQKYHKIDFPKYANFLRLCSLEYLVYNPLQYPRQFQIVFPSQLHSCLLLLSSCPMMPICKAEATLSPSRPQLSGLCALAVLHISPWRLASVTVLPKAITSPPARTHHLLDLDQVLGFPNRHQRMCALAIVPTASEVLRT